MSEPHAVTTPNAKIAFVPTSTHVFVRPGQQIVITVGETKVEVEGIDHPPFRDTSSDPHKADMMVILRAGEMYSALRDDDTILKVRAE